MDMDRQARPRGRPRSFDREAALDAAMRLFWRRGYEATSVADLADAMAVNPPSLYAAFGDKRRLFLEAVELYETGPGSFAAAALEEASTAREAVERLFRGAVEAYSDPDVPAGCMVVLSATNCGPDAQEIQDLLAAKRRRSEAAICERIARGRSEGDVPEAVDADVLAGFVAAVFQGLSIKARDGASREALQAIAQRAMAAWPGETSS